MTSTNDHADVSLSMDVNLPLGYGSGRIEFGKKIVLSVQGKKIAVPEHVFWNKAALTEFVNLQMDLHRTLTGETLRSFSIEASNLDDVQRHDAGEQKIRAYEGAEAEREALADLTVNPVEIEAGDGHIYLGTVRKRRTLQEVIAERSDADVYAARTSKPPIGDNPFQRPGRSY
jgi:hypothetical protein